MSGAATPPDATVPAETRLVLGGRSQDGGRETLFATAIIGVHRQALIRVLILLGLKNSRANKRSAVSQAFREPGTFKTPKKESNRRSREDIQGK